MQRYILTILILGLCAAPGWAEEWKQVVDRNEITVFARPVEGSTMDQFKGITIVNAPIEVCTAVLRDIPAQTEWMGDNLQAEVLRVFSDDHKVAYNVLKSPWPLKPRDLQIDVTFIEDSDQVMVEMKVYPETIVPVSKEYIRVTDFEASCCFERLADNRTKVTYINRVNPMAPVPPSITNLVVRGNPYATLSGLKQMVTKEKYQLAAN